MNKDLQRSINLFVPLLLAAGAGYMAYRKKVSWQMLLVIFGVTWLVLWLLTRQAVKLIATSENKQAKIPVDTSTGGVLPDNFNATGWVERIKKDIYGLNIFGHDTELWRSLVNLNDSQSIAIGNRWNDLYFSEYNEGLPAAIDDEYMSGDAYKYAKLFNDRLKRLGFV